MSKIRKSPIALSLVKNSKTAMFSAIEIHNKPIIKYRYEIVVILVLNAWELLLKAYIYKFISPKKIFKESGKSISFIDSVEIIRNKFGRQYLPLCENLYKLYNYRNQVSHFYTEDLDIIIFSLIKKTLQYYSDFIKLHFSSDLSEESDLILLPLGFKKFYSPIDFLSNESYLRNSSIEVKKFISDILNSSKLLASHGIDDAILVDFDIHLGNVKNIKNADIIAGIDNSKSSLPFFSITKANPQKIFVTTSDAKQLTISQDLENTQGVLIHEELSDQLFDEINNVVNANNLIAKAQGTFVLGELAYYRIYSERKNVANINDNFYTLACGGYTYYAPFLYWISNMKPKQIAQFVNDSWVKCKHPNVYNLIVLTTLLGKETSQFILRKLNMKFEKVVQKPNYYYTFQESIISKKDSDIRLLALRSSESKSIMLYNQKVQPTLKNFLLNENEASKALSIECMAYFHEKNVNKTTMKTLDIIENGKKIFEKADKVYEEIVKL